MSNGLNKVLIIGNLGNDPEIKYTQSGSPVANLSIATSERWKDKNSCLLYTSPSPRDALTSRMPSSA